MHKFQNVVITRELRRTLSIKISSKAEIIIKAPFFVSKGYIDNFLKEKEEWIVKSLEKVEKRIVKNKQYQEEEEFLHLGKMYKLHFGNFKEISITNVLQFPLALKFRAKKELTNWYIKQAKELITKRVNYHSKKMEKNFTSIMFSDTSSKWGTCFADNRLQFNWRLIMAPILVLDYVVIHELTHTVEKNHGPIFWRNIRLFTPAYRQYKKWLTDNARFLTI